jgi:hypothetical protein
MAAVSTAGTCHNVNVRVAAHQHKTRCAIVLLIRWTTGVLPHERMIETTRCGRAFSIATTGAPIKIKGAATLIKSRC